MDASSIIVEIVIGCAIIGGLVGSKRNQIGKGILWGLLLGPIGWFIVARKEVPQEDLPERSATLTGKVRLPPMIYIMREGREDGPYTVNEVVEKYERREIDPTALCACPGDEAWVPVEERISRVLWAGFSFDSNGSDKRFAC